jgi:translation initiation factor 1
MKNRNKKSLPGGMVYSTDPDWSPSEENKTDIIPPESQNLRVWLDRKQRAGKVVTLVRDFIGPDEELEELAKILKSRCGTGGSAKDGEIIIQGDFRDRVLDILTKEGYRAKKAGG